MQCARGCTHHILQVVFLLQGLPGTTGPFAQAVRGTNTLPEKGFSALLWVSSASVPEMATGTLLNAEGSLCAQDYSHQPCVTQGIRTQVTPRD